MQSPKACLVCETNDMVTRLEKKREGKPGDQRGMQQPLYFDFQLLNDVSFSRNFLCIYEGIFRPTLEYGFLPFGKRQWS